MDHDEGGSAAAEGPNQYARWQAALGGAELDLGARGDPPSGFYRFKPWGDYSKRPERKYQTCVALWRGEGDDAEIYVEENFKRPRLMSALEADELFTSQCVPISYDLYEERRRLADIAAPWPPIHTIYPPKPYPGRPAVVWTEEWARKTLAADVENYDERGEPRQKAAGAKEAAARIADKYIGVDGSNVSPSLQKAAAAVVEAASSAIGANGGPQIEAGGEPERKIGADEQLAARVKTVGQALAARLKAIGGKPRSKEEADEVANYAVKFAEMRREGEEARKEEKEPHLRAGQAVDAKWKAVTDLAEKSRAKALEIAGAFLSEAEAKAAAEAKAKTEAARREAERVAAETGEKPAEVRAVEPEKIKLGTGRRTVSAKTQTVVQVVDYAAFWQFLMKHGVEHIPSFLVEACNKAAGSLVEHFGTIPGVEKTEVKVAS